MNMLDVDKYAKSFIHLIVLSQNGPLGIENLNVQNWRFVLELYLLGQHWKYFLSYWSWSWILGLTALTGLDALLLPGVEHVGDAELQHEHQPAVGPHPQRRRGRAAAL